MKRFRLLAVLFLLVPAAAIPADTADEAYPTIRHAIASLEQTRTELEDGEYGFGGHRSMAIEHIDAALQELHQALEYAGDHPGDIKTPSK